MCCPTKKNGERERMVGEESTGREWIRFMVLTWKKEVLGMKAVRNSRENTLTIPAPAFFSREREQERESRMGKRIRYYGISGTEYFDREHIDYDWESITQNGNIDACNHFK